MPTDAEIIFWVVAAILAFGFIIFIASRADRSIDITWGQRRDWERRERKWGK